MKLNDTTIGILLLVASIAIWMSAQNFSRLPNQSYGSETMPLALSALTFVLGAFMIVRSVIAGAPMPRVELAEWARSPGAVAGFFATIALVIAYILLTDRVGFVPVSVAVMLALMLVMRVRWWVALPLAVLATLAIQQSFGRLLLVPLPRNDFLNFLW